MGGIISNFGNCHITPYDVIVYVTVVTSELSLSSCVVAQSTGSAVARFNNLKICICNSY